MLPRRVTVIQAGADHDRPDGRTAAVAMLAEDYEYVIGGDPDRDTIDLAVLDTATGRHLHPCLLGVQENRERWIG